MKAEEQSPPRRGVLDPVERLSEVLFGLIMVLTFTGSLSVATADRAEVKTVLIGAIGCNIAWGLIDAIMYLMACLTERGAEVRTFHAVRLARSRHHAHEVIRSQLPQVVAAELQPEQFDSIRARIMDIHPKPLKPRLGRDDWRGALGVFLVVVAATFPVIVPFLFMRDVALAMRISDGIAVGMLAIIGFAYGKASGIPPWWTSASMVLIGAALVGITMALGG
jgi:hypothetical protein